jgi:hypothetical protein
VGTLAASVARVYHVPRLLELLLATQAPVFDFRVSGLKVRLARWSAAERAIVVALAEALWAVRRG